MTFDRDSRWVGSQSLRYFPSAFCRLRLGLGIHPNICPPRRPDKNASVERLHRTLNFVVVRFERKGSPYTTNKGKACYDLHIITMPVHAHLTDYDKIACSSEKEAAARRLLRIMCGNAL